MLRIGFIGTGGTIAVSSGDDGPGAGHSSIEPMLAGIRADLSGRAVIEFVDTARMSSRSILLADILRLTQQIRELLSDFDAIVVSHGTDTLEETAYAVAMMVESPKPVIFTGAMRRSADRGADGGANIDAAVHVAASPGAAGRGVLVVLQDEIHSARWVTKMHTVRVAAFGSPEAGPLGVLCEGKPVWYPSVPAPEYLGVPDSLDKRVELILVTVGADGWMVDLVADTIDGLVLAGTGGGHLPGQMMPAVERVIAQGKPVVLTSRTGVGPLLSRTYRGPGSESDLIQKGVIMASSLSPLKARLRLILTLALGADPRHAFQLIDAASDPDFRVV
jgi:L-asparaginase